MDKTVLTAAHLFGSLSRSFLFDDSGQPKVGGYTFELSGGETDEIISLDSMFYFLPCGRFQIPGTHIYSGFRF